MECVVKSKDEDNCTMKETEMIVSPEFSKQRGNEILMTTEIVEMEEKEGR